MAVTITVAAAQFCGLLFYSCCCSLKIVAVAAMSAVTTAAVAADCRCEKVDFS